MNSSPKEKKKKPFTPSLRKLSTVAGVLFLSIFVLNIVVDNPWTHNFIRTIINERIQNELDLSFDFQAMEISAIPLSVTLYGFSASHFQATEPILSASRLSAQISLPGIIMGQPRLSQLDFNELKYSYTYNRTPFLGPQTLDEAKSAIYWPPDFELPIEKLSMENSSIVLRVIHDQKVEQNLEVRLQGMNLELDIDHWQDFSLSINSTMTDVQYNQAHILQSARVSGSLLMDREGLHANDLSIKSHDINSLSKLKLEIKTYQQKYRGLTAKYLSQQFLDAISINISSSFTDSNLSALGRFLHLEKTSGSFAGETRTVVNVPMKDDKDITWQIAGSAKAKDAIIDDFYIYDPALDFILDEDKINFSKVEISTKEKVRANLQGLIRFDENLRFDFRTDFHQLLFSDLLSSVKVRNFDFFEGDLYTHNAQIIGQGYPFKLTVKGDLFLQGLLTPTLNYRHNKFPVPPDCLFQLELVSNSDYLSFEKTFAYCMDKLAALPTKMPIKLESLYTTARHLSKIEFSGKAHYDPSRGMDMNISSKELDLGMATYFSQVPQEGVVAADIRINGPYENIAMQVDFKGSNTIIAGFPFGTITGSMSSLLPQNRLLFNKVHAIPDKGGAISIASGYIDLNQLKTFNAQVNIEGIDSDFIKKGLIYFAPEQGIALGLKNLHGTLKGPLLYPLLYQGDVSFELTDAFYRGQNLFSSLKGGLWSKGKTIKSNDLVYTFKTFKTPLSVNYTKKHSAPQLQNTDWLTSIGGTWQDLISIKIPEQKTARSQQNILQDLPFAGSNFKQFHLDGSLGLKLDIEGPIEHQKGIFTIDILQPKLLDNPIAPIKLTGIIDRTNIEFSEIVQRGNSLLGRMNLDWGQESIPFDWYFRFQNFDLRAFGTRYFYQDPRNYAYFTGHWKLKGNFKNWWRSQGEGAIDAFQAKLIRDGTMGWKALKVTQKSPIELNFTSTSWGIRPDQSWIVEGEEANLVLTTQNNSPPSNLGVQLAGNFDAQILKHFIPNVDSSKGFVTFNGTLKGPVQNPDLELIIEDKKPDQLDAGEWSPLSLNFSLMPPAFNKILMKIIYKNGVFHLDKFTSEKGATGKLRAAGQLNFNEDLTTNSAVNIAFERLGVRRFPISIFVFDGEVSGDMIVSGNKFPLSISGNLVIDKANSIGNFDIRNQIINSINKRKMNIKSQATEELLDLDLTVNAPRTIKIRNRNIVATLTANLKVKGSETQPLIIGTLEINEGKFFYKRDFRIRRGNIVFVAANYPPDPTLDIVAEAVVSQYVVRITISGYSSEPKVEMTIDPPIRPDGTPISNLEILLLLTQGRLPENSSSRFQDQAREEAVNLAISQFEQPIERLFDISGQTVVRQVYFDTTSDEEGKLSPRINLPFHFTDDVNVIVQVDDESNVKVSSEYSIHNSISFSWSVDRKKEEDKTLEKKETDSGVDLKFRFSFP